MRVEREGRVISGKRLIFGCGDKKKNIKEGGKGVWIFCEF